MTDDDVDAVRRSAGSAAKQGKAASQEAWQQ